MRRGTSLSRVAVVLVLAGCGSKGAPPPESAIASSRARAEALVANGAALPPRAETVAVADAVAIESSKAGRSEGGASLAILAGDLRARLYRFDRSASDGREALELYAAAASASLGAAVGCQADRKRALLAGAVAGNAASVYQELYVASKREAALAAKRTDADAALARCLADLENSLAETIAYRPSGDGMRALEQTAQSAADAAVRGAVAVATPSSSNTSTAGAALTSTPIAMPGPSGDVVVSPKEGSFAEEAVKITSVEPFGSEQSARVVLHLTGPTSFQVGTLAADDASGKDARVYVDLARASFKGVKRETVVGGALRRVRLGEHKGATRVVLDLAANLHRRVFYLPDPFRVVIDVSTHAPDETEKHAAGGERVIRRLVLDPGHGGIDTGAVGPTGLKEKDVTLDIAHRVAPLLAHELKIETLVTRDDDTYVPLDLRTARANAFHGDLFVSIHCNASENGTARGVQTFVLDEAKETAAARAAAWENTPKGKPSESIKPKDSGEIGLIAANLNVGDLSARSRHVADLLQRSALASLGQRWPDTKDQGIKSAGFFVLVGADMPAVLFETAFISNPEDESRLNTADYRQKLADSIVNAVKAYKAGK